MKKTKRAMEVFCRQIAEKLFEKLDDQFDLRTSQTASTAMQCLAKIGKLISLANCFSSGSSEVGINGRFGRLNGMLGVGSGHRVIPDRRDIERVFRASSNKASGHDIVRAS
jgi:hypothetical protein